MIKVVCNDGPEDGYSESWESWDDFFSSGAGQCLPEGLIASLVDDYLYISDEPFARRDTSLTLRYIGYWDDGFKLMREWPAGMSAEDMSRSFGLLYEMESGET